MEEKNIQAGGGRRLVLGFDAGCTRCSELARRIEEQVGGMLEVRSLYDPQMEHWREQTLGKDAAWAPTLVEIVGGQTKAWTGLPLGVRLGRYLGPIGTWRVMQTLGEIGSSGSGFLSGDHEFIADDRRRLTRSRFIRGALGAAAAVSVLSGTGVLSSPASAREKDTSEPIDHRELNGQELGEIARNVAGRTDVTNVMGASWSRKVRTGRIAKTQADGQDINVLTNDVGASVRADKGGVSVSGDGVVVKAAKHNLEGGNGLLAVAYLADNWIVAYYEFDEPVDGTKSKAEVWEVQQEKDAVVLKTASRNGVLESSVPSSKSVSSRDAGIYCGGCSSSKRRRRVRVCNRVSYWCLAINCGFCILGTPGYLKLACVYVYCPYLVTANTGSCCKSGGASYACAGCTR